jgi:hypothetical protein
MLTKITTYQCRDGVVRPNHADALRHELQSAIPAALVALMRENYGAINGTEISADAMRSIVTAMLLNPEALIKLVNDYTQAREAVEEYNAQARNRENAAGILAAKGINLPSYPLSQEIDHA